MIYTKYKKNYFYRNQKNIIFTNNSAGNKEDNTILLFCTPSLDDTFNILKNSSLRLMQSKYKYFVADTYVAERIGRSTVRLNNLTQLTQKFKHDVSDEVPFFKFVPAKQMAKVKDKKYMYDLSLWNDLYFKHRVEKSKQIMAREYINFILSKINYGENKSRKKILYVPLNIIGAKKASSYGVEKECLDDILSCILTLIYFDKSFNGLGDDIEILLHDTSTMDVLVLDNELLNRKSFPKLKMLLKRFKAFKWNPSVDTEEEKHTDAMKETIKQEIFDNVKKNFVDVVQSNIDMEEDINKEDHPSIEDEPVQEEPVDDDNPLKAVKSIPSDEEIENAINNLIDNDDEVLIAYNSGDGENKEVVNAMVARALKPFSIKVGDDQRSDKVKKNIKEFMDIQNKIIKPVDVDEADKIDEEDYSNIVITGNSDIVKTKSNNFEKSYNAKLMESDIDSCLTNLNNAEIGMYVVDKTVEDTSDALSATYTYRYTLKDENGKKHTISVVLPKLVDDRYIFYNGNKWIIQTQRLLKPISKVKPTRVEIVTMYNKVTINRVEKNVNPLSTMLKKVLTTNASKYSVKFGDATVNNKPYFMDIERASISRNIFSFTNPSKDIVINLSVDTLYKELDKLGIDYSKYKKPEDRKYICGYNKKTKKPIILNDTFVNYVIYNILDEKDRKAILNGEINVGRKFMYNEAKMFSKKMPMIVFMLYCGGWKKVLDLIGVNYRVYPDKKSVEDFDPTRDAKIEFADCVFVWDNSQPSVSLLMNGLPALLLKAYTLEEMENIDTYTSIIMDYYGYTDTYITLGQFRDFLIDPVTKDVLMKDGLPYTLLEVFKYASDLLADTSYISENDFRNSRCRNNEIIAQELYSAVTSAYLKVRRSKNSNKTASISIDKNVVMKRLMLEKIVENVSVLNPILEVEKSKAITFKGPSGINLEDAFTLDKRAFDPSMVGITGISTTPDAGVGVLRQLTFEPKITSTRGFVDTTDPDELEELTALNLLTPSELLSPPGVLHDDPPRTSMAYKQSKYMLPLASSSPVIVGNKVEDVVAYQISNDLAFKAKEDGTIIDANDNYVVIKYKSGKTEAIDISKRVLKNGSNGFFIESQLTCDRKVGYKFKKNEILAYDKVAFTRKYGNGNAASMNIGVLCKVAIFPEGLEFEDSAPISEALAERLAVDVIMESGFTVSKNSFVEYLAKVGDHVKTGDNLVVFDSTEGDASIMDFLDKLREENKEEIINATMTKYATAESGDIVDLKIYTACELDELSDSLKKIVGDYYKQRKDQYKILNDNANPEDNKYNVCGQFLTEYPEKSSTGYTNMLKGFNIKDKVLFLFYIKHKDIAKKGDKVTNYTALKGVISEVLPNDKAPYALSRPDETIDSMISPLSVLARKTPSILFSMFSNKVMIELTRQIREYYLNDNE